MCEGRGGRLVLCYLDLKPPFTVFAINVCSMKNTAFLPHRAVIDSFVDESRATFRKRKRGANSELGYTNYLCQSQPLRLHRRTKFAAQYSMALVPEVWKPSRNEFAKKSKIRLNLTSVTMSLSASRKAPQSPSGSQALARAATKIDMNFSASIACQYTG